MPEQAIHRSPDFPRISDYPFHYAALRPQSEAICYGSQRLDYTTFAADIESCASALLAAGVKRGDRVAMLSTPRPEYLVHFMATVRIGAIWLGLNPRYQSEELAHILGETQPALLCTIARFEGRNYVADLNSLPSRILDNTPIVLIGDSDLLPTDLKAAMHWEQFLETANDIDASSLKIAVEEVQPKDPALIVYTSGSSGQPKGALLCHLGIVTSTRIQCEHWWAEPFRILNNLPINHIGGAIQIGCQAIVAGGTNVLMDRFDPVAIPGVVESQGITIMHQVATMYQLVLDKGRLDTHDLSSLQALVWSGAPAAKDLIRRLRKIVPTLFTSYGSTEVGGEVLYSNINAPDELLATTVGTPDSHIPVRLADEAGNPVAPGEAGEIQVYGDTVMLGYFNYPQASLDALTPDGWVRTGDLGQIRDDGQYCIVGRLKEMYKSGGYNVYPREIEMVLERYPGVSAAIVVAVPDPLFGEIGFAFLLREPGESMSNKEIRKFCQELLANYKVPKHFEICTELPMLPIGKVDRKALREQANSIKELIS